jgi:hypothetical protein
MSFLRFRRGVSIYGECQMGELSRGERLQIMLTHAELRIIDTWRFARRMPSRAAAIRELLKRGMTAEGFAEVEDGQKSKDFTVLPDTPAE